MSDFNNFYNWVMGSPKVSANQKRVVQRTRELLEGKVAFVPRADRLNAPAIRKSLGNDGSMVAFRRLWEKYQKYIRRSIVAIRTKWGLHPYLIALRDRRQHYQLPRANVLPVVTWCIIMGSWHVISVRMLRLAGGCAASAGKPSGDVSRMPRCFSGAICTFGAETVRTGLLTKLPQVYLR